MAKSFVYFSYLCRQQFIFVENIIEEIHYFYVILNTYGKLKPATLLNFIETSYKSNLRLTSRTQLL